MAEIKNLERLVAKLRARAARAVRDGNVSGVVGYTANYALWVHENVEMKLQGEKRPEPLPGVYWGPHGQAKFLEAPARQLADDGTLSGTIAQALRAGKTIGQAILLACLRLQRESQKLVPVVTGNLRASAFTRLERGQ